jgi:hypothetical protein
MRFDPSGPRDLHIAVALAQRIGTQFKCFVTVRHADAIEAVKQFLQGCDRINNLSVSKSVKSNRIYFLLDRFDQATTVDGHANNWRIQSEGTRTSRADRWIPFGSQYERPPRARGGPTS